jgi:hypothetical protein
MILFSAAALLMSYMEDPALRPVPRRKEVAQVVIQERTIVRVPVRIRQSQPANAHFSWSESKGPKCIPMAQISGATFLGQNSVDLILKDRSRVRARLESKCPALDYYYGFYLTRSKDGKICADRDIIRSRVGGQCEIENFRTLTAVPKR